MANFLGTKLILFSYFCLIKIKALNSILLKYFQDLKFAYFYFKNLLYKNLILNYSLTIFYS